MELHALFFSLSALGYNYSYYYVKRYLRFSLSSLAPRSRRLTWSTSMTIPSKSLLVSRASSLSWLKPCISQQKCRGHNVIDTETTHVYVASFISHRVYTALMCILLAVVMYPPFAQSSSDTVEGRVVQTSPLLHSLVKIIEREMKQLQDLEQHTVHITITTVYSLHSHCPKVSLSKESPHSEDACQTHFHNYCSGADPGPSIRVNNCACTVHVKILTTPFLSEPYPLICCDRD